MEGVGVVLGRQNDSCVLKSAMEVTDGYEWPYQM